MGKIKFKEYQIVYSNLKLKSTPDANYYTFGLRPFNSELSLHVIFERGLFN